MVNFKLYSQNRSLIKIENKTLFIEKHGPNTCDLGIQYKFSDNLISELIILDLDISTNVLNKEKNINGKNYKFFLRDAKSQTLYYSAATFGSDKDNTQSSRLIYAVNRNGNIESVEINGWLHQDPKVNSEELNSIFVPGSYNIDENLKNDSLISIRDTTVSGTKIQIIQLINPLSIIKIVNGMPVGN